MSKREELPMNLTLVRHGENGWLVASEAERQLEVTPARLERLTSTGEQQAECCREWLSRNLNFQITQYYSSHQCRAVQTALILGPSADWNFTRLLREREGRQESREPWVDVDMRAEQVLSELRETASGGNALVVSHGGMMWSFRRVLEAMSAEHFHGLYESDHPHNEIRPAQVIQYTRQDHESGIVENHYGWMRSVCPWDMTLSGNVWVKV